MSAPKGPFTAHIVHDGRNGLKYTKAVRKTRTAAENHLRWHESRVVARWITNAEGRVFSSYDRGDPVQILVAIERAPQ